MSYRATVPRWARLPLRALMIGSQVFLWGLALAMFVTGLVMWRDWHALARGGVSHDALVERCEWESMAHKGLRASRGSSGYWSCHYRYRPDAAGPEFRGYFQSPREWKPGEPVAIRYLAERKDASATEANLEHPKVLPGALIALPVAFAGFWFWQRRRAARG
jgi:hypothetical protein